MPKGSQGVPLCWLKPCLSQSLLLLLMMMMMMMMLAVVT
jgi:hypothetical protein